MKIITLLFIFVAVALASNSNVAVRDFEGLNVDTVDALIITERFRTELVTTGSFNVLERKQVNSILEEQGFILSGCVDNSCNVEVGQLLGVEYIIVGTIGKIEGTYTVTLRLVNISSGKIQNTVTGDCAGPLSDVLMNTTKELAEKLVLQVQNAEYGTLNIKSEPTGSQVYLNDIYVGKTPFSSTQLLPGDYTLLIKQEKFKTISDSLLVSSGTLLKREFALEHTSSYLDSLKRVEKKEKRKKKFVRQAILGSIALTGGIMGLISDNKVKELDKEYVAAGDAYLNAGIEDQPSKLYDKYEQKGKEVDQEIKKRNILYSASGTFTFAFCLSFVF